MTWLKTVGIVFIISGFGLFGLMGASRIEKRVKQLKAMRLAINFLEKEITCMHTPLSRALARTGQFSMPPVNCLFLECARQLQDREGLTAGEAWSYGIKKLRKNSDFKDEDLELLGLIAVQIGMSDITEQRKLFDLIQEELRIQEEKALQEVDSKHKMWAYGGFILGTTVVLLLI